jgi:hypothetical protein
VADEALDPGGVLGFLAPPARAGAIGRLAHYEVAEVLARGGFGIVLKAFDEKLHRVVAIKVLGPQLVGSGTARKRFLREARAAAAVRHDHVVAIHAVDDHPVPYLVMDYIGGLSLQEKLERDGPLPVPEIVRIGVEVAEGLAAAHRHGLVHRDIKPGNILLEDGVGRVRLTDFGLARAVDDASATQSGVIAGTPMYMAPEQARGEAVDQRSDLFSLGSVLYAMCTGRPPFRASSTLAVLKRVCEDEPRPIRELNPEIPEWLCSVITRLQTKAPPGRYGSAREVADLLAGALCDLRQHGLVRSLPPPPVAIGPPPNPATGSHWSRSALLGGLAGACCLGLVGVGLAEVTGYTDLARTVVRHVRPEGTLVVEIEDPGVSLAIDGDDMVITGAGVREIRLRAGRHTVRTLKDGKVVRQELVRIERDGRRVLRVLEETVEPPPTAGTTGFPPPLQADLEQARRHARADRWGDVGRDFERAFHRAGSDYTRLVLVGTELVRLCEARGQGPRSVTILRTIAAQLPNVLVLQSWLATLAAYYGDSDAERLATERLLEYWGQSTNPDVGLHVALALNHAQVPGVDRDDVVRLARLTTGQHPDWPFAQHFLAHAQYNAGRYEDALRSLDAKDRAGPWMGAASSDLLRAMIRARLGQDAEARQLLEMARQWDRTYLTPEPSFDSPAGDGLNWFMFKLLLRRAESVVPGPDR